MSPSRASQKVAGAATGTAFGCSPALATALNLAWPGSGIVLLGATWIGLIFGAAFILLANLVVVALFITPADFARSGQLAAVVSAVLCYAAAQIALVAQIRTSRELGLAAQSRELLREIERLAGEGEAQAALDLLEPLRARRPDDLSLTHWHATLLTAVGRRDDARCAWQHLRRIDRHGLFRDVIRANL